MYLLGKRFLLHYTRYYRRTSLEVITSSLMGPTEQADNSYWRKPSAVSSLPLRMILNWIGSSSS